MAIKRRSSGKTLLAFLALGPPIGGVALGLNFIAVDVLDGGRFSWDAFTTLPLLAIAAYIYGLLPAFFTGVMAMGLSPRIRSHRLWLCAVTMTGFVSGVAYVFLSVDYAVMFGAVGAIAALGCGILSLTVRPLEADVTPARS